MEKIKESNFTHEITIPSLGLLNPEIPGGVVKQRCMMVSDQKFLSGSNQSAGSAINQILQNTTVAPEGFDVDNLTTYDTLYLLFKLRILSYGSKYKFRTRCPECGQKIDVTVDLSEIPVENIEEDFAEKMVVELPHRGDKVYTKLLTNKDSEEINKELKRRKKRHPDDDSDYIVRIARSIDKIVLSTPDEEGKKELTNFYEIEQYVSNLTDLDAAAIVATRDKIVFGINPIMEYTCPECKEYIDISLQFSPEFFRPSFS